MSQNRRNFIEALIAASVATGVISETGITRSQFESALSSEVESQSGDPDSSSQSEEPHDAHRFWQNYFNYLEPTKGNEKPSVEAQDRRVQYLHLGAKGFRYVNDVKVEELLDYDGDVLVTATLGQYRPGADDHVLLGNIKTSQLRIDFVQTRPLLNVLAPMAWAALAVFYHDKVNKLPSLDSLGYKKASYLNGIERVVLPKGSGRFAVNLATVKPESTFHKILKLVVPAVTAAAPVLNLPAISVPVMKVFSEIFLGPETEKRTTFLLNSLPAQWIATQQARLDSELGIENLPLVSGNYVMVPAAHAEELGKELPNLDWQSGYLVRKDASPNEPPSKRAERAVEGVTYISMRLTVTKVPPNTASPKAEGGDEGAETEEKRAKPKASPSPTKPKSQRPEENLSS